MGQLISREVRCLSKKFHLLEDYCLSIFNNSRKINETWCKHHLSTRRCTTRSLHGHGVPLRGKQSTGRQPNSGERRTRG